jgi:peptide/nickel transport system ATP-binding protein/Fe3+-transporting ATPase
MLRADRLAFRYRARLPWVVQQFSLELAPGERVGLSGASGRGKTTLGKLLAGYLEPQQGRVLLDGQPLPRRGCCPVQLVLQHPELAINPRWRIGRVLHEAGPPAPDLLDALGIAAGWLKRWPHELSGGELQRIAVARALAAQPRYLVADEMTAMLDAATQAQIWHAVLEWARTQQIGLLVISHSDALLRRLCQRCIDLPDLPDLPAGEA